MVSSTLDVEAEVMRLLAESEIEILVKVCEVIELPIPSAKTGKRTLILKLLMKYLTNDDIESSDDGGKEILDKIYSELVPGVDIPPPLEKEHDILGLHEVKTENTDKMGRNYEEFSIHHFREFKINGTVGAVDQKDTLSYTSLSFQMKRGREAGFSYKGIRAAVIKAIKPGTNLRNYLEIKPNISENAFIKILRSHYNEKDASSVFQEMSNCTQLSTESELEFCLRVMSLREKVVSLSAEEQCTFDSELIRKKFFQTMYTGLKHNSVRMGLHNTLKAGIANDEDLLDEISLVVLNESEHISKQKLTDKKLTAKNVNINSLQDTLPSLDKNLNQNSKTGKENPILIEIQKLSAQVSQLSSVQKEVSALKNKIDSFDFPANSYSRQDENSSDFNTRSSRRKFMFRCAACERDKSNFCNHCFLCGSTGHRKYKCPNGQKNE